MLNHARTLLLNRSTTGVQDFSTPGEELLPEQFVAVELPSYLTAIRRLLFGATPDRWMLNYRACQYMTILRQQPLAEYLSRHDARTTYSDPFVWDEELFTPKAVRLSGVATDKLTIGGEAKASDATGVMYTSFNVDVQDNDTVRITRLQPPSTAKSYDFSLVGGVSAPLGLPGSDYTVKLYTTNPGASWLVEIVEQPKWDLGQIVASMDQIGGVNLVPLFGAGQSEPYRTWRNLWQQQRELPLRLGALLLAVIERTEERRTANG